MQNLELSGVFPSFGPQSGGTLLSISGSNLNMGSNVTAMLDDLPCLVNSTHASATRLLCNSSRTDAPRRISQLTVIIDDAKRVLTHSPFTYTKDPTVMEIKPLHSFASGGRLLSVHGTNLDSIQKPKMVVFMDDGLTIANWTVTTAASSIDSQHSIIRPFNSTQICRVLSASQMECPSPPVDFEMINAKRQSTQQQQEPQQQQQQRRKRAGLRAHRNVPRSLTLRIGFVMDNVESVRDLKKHFQNLQYVEDPIYSVFTGVSLIKLYKVTSTASANEIITTEICNVEIL